MSRAADDLLAVGILGGRSNDHGSALQGKLYKLGKLSARLAQPSSCRFSMYWPLLSVALTSAACFAQVLRGGMCSRRAWSCALQERPLSTTEATTRPSMRCMQKDRRQSVKVRPRTAIERAPSLGAAARIAFTTAGDRTVRLWPCATQTVQLR